MDLSSAVIRFGFRLTTLAASGPARLRKLLDHPPQVLFRDTSRFLQLNPLVDDLD